MANRLRQASLLAPRERRLRTHADGRLWLHTGDLGSMDADGFVTFASRSKRMIKSSGFNVYPSQVETVLQEHPAVAESCVTGVPDESQGHRVRAYVVVRDPASATDALAAELIAHCRERLIKWSCPRDVVFRAELPLTKIGRSTSARSRRRRPRPHRPSGRAVCPLADRG